MAEHMQAVKTVWKFEFTGHSGIARRTGTEKQNEINETLYHLFNNGYHTVKMIEERTCDAMPGMVYTKENVIDLDLLFS